jgi:hypothetical protein
MPMAIEINKIADIVDFIPYIEKREQEVTGICKPKMRKSIWNHLLIVW